MQEHEDTLEVECKFVSDASENSVVQWLDDFFPDEYTFVKWPPCVNFDIYLDTPDRDLLRLNGPLRLRRWGSPFKHKLLISSNFKYPPDIRQGLRRRELKTLLSEQESQRVCDGHIVGDSVAHAAKFLGEAGADCSGFRPQAIITTYCSLYVLRKRADVIAGAALRGKENDLLLLSFEQCTVQACPEGDYRRLVRNGMIDYLPTGIRGEFSEAELEIVAPPSAFALGEELYARAFGELERRGAQMSLRSKYSRAIEALGDA
jgi:CYTH domain